MRYGENAEKSNREKCGVQGGVQQVWGAGRYGEGVGYTGRCGVSGECRRECENDVRCRGSVVCVVVREAG